MTPRRILIVAFSALALAGAGGVACAQDQGPSAEIRDRLDRLEKQLHEVREIVLQARSTGQPVEIKEAGPDPQVTALAAKFDDMDQTLRSLNGEVETLTHDVQVANKSAADAKAAADALADRLTKLEQQVATLAAPPPAAAGPPSPDANAQPADTTGDPKAAYAHARQLLLDGDYQAAQAAFQDYVDHYASSPDAAPARYWLGETKYVQQDYAGAAVAYIAAKRGWPQTTWGADAMIKLSLSLMQLNKPADACAALDEFARHYAKASDAAKSRAAAARITAKCAA